MPEINKDSAGQPGKSPLAESALIPREAHHLILNPGVVPKFYTAFPLTREDSSLAIPFVVQTRNNLPQIFLRVDLRLLATRPELVNRKSSVALVDVLFDEIGQDPRQNLEFAVTEELQRLTQRGIELYFHNARAIYTFLQIAGPSMFKGVPKVAQLKAGIKSILKAQ